MPIPDGDTERLQAQFVELFRVNMCDISKTCRAMKMARGTFYNWQERSPQFATAIQEVRDEEKDWWESQLKILARGIPIIDPETRKLIGWKEKPDTAAVIFGNKTINRDRGYNDKIDVNVNIGLQPRIDLMRLTQAERDTWYKLLDKATVENGDSGSLPGLKGGNGQSESPIDDIDFEPLE